jgi:hypothetical protein
MWIGVVASDLKIAVGLEVPSRFVGQVLARLATAGVIVVAHPPQIGTFFRQTLTEACT